MFGIGAAIMAAAAVAYGLKTPEPVTEATIPESEKIPRREPPAPKTDITGIPRDDIEELVVYRKGESPIVVMPWLHPLTTTQGNIILPPHVEIINRFRRTALSLYDISGINGLVLEGLNRESLPALKRGGKIFDAKAHKSDAWTEVYNDTLHDRKWFLEASTLENIENPLMILKYRTFTNLDELCREYVSRGWFDSKDIAGEHLQEMARDSYKRVFGPYALSLEDYLKTDPGASKAFEHHCRRDTALIDAAVRSIDAGASGCMIAIGRGHERRLVSLLDKSGRPYAVVRLKGVGKSTEIDEDSERETWLADSVAYGEQTKVKAKGFTMTINTGMVPVYHKLGIKYGSCDVNRNGE